MVAKIEAKGAAAAAAADAAADVAAASTEKQVPTSDVLARIEAMRSKWGL